MCCFSCTCALVSCASECVGAAACDNVLCSSCISGSFYAGATETPTAGSCVVACVAPPDATCLGNPTAITSATPPQCLYKSSCLCQTSTPCSPNSCGATDSPPSSSQSSGPKGGGSGAGSAAPSSGGGGKSGGGAGTACQSKLSQLLNRFGATMGSLFSGGRNVQSGVVLAGQKPTGLLATMTPNTFLLVLIVVGGLLLVMAFGHKNVPD